MDGIGLEPHALEHGHFVSRYLIGQNGTLDLPQLVSRESQIGPFGCFGDGSRKFQRVLYLAKLGEHVDNQSEGKKRYKAVKAVD